MRVRDRLRLGISLVVIAATAMGIFVQSSLAEPPAKDKAGDKTAAPKTDAKAVSNKKKEEKLRFVRVDRDGKTPRSLQTAIASYEVTEGEFKGAKIDLIGAVHIGSKEYYEELNKRFKSYEVVLYELVAHAESNRPDMRAETGFNPLSGLQSGMKEALSLAYQLGEIDYSAKNFVHADMSPDEFAKDMEERKDSFVGMFARLLGAGIAEQSTKRGQQQQSDMLAAMISKDPIKLRRVLAEQFDNMGGQMAGFADKEGKSTILTERNRKAFEVLQSELEAGKTSISVFYGAAHLNDMHERLLRDFNAKLLNKEWLDAWPLK